jgi:hypothetical protein
MGAKDYAAWARRGRDSAVRQRPGSVSAVRPARPGSVYARPGGARPGGDPPRLRAVQRDLCGFARPA